MARDLDETKAQIARSMDRFVAIRRDIHAHPELSNQEQRTSDLVAALLVGWGYEVERNIGGHGLVATLRRGGGARSVGLRADMDALPIYEETNLPYASRNSGVMHACGHDGHTASLLCAAENLALHGSFDGTLRLIFQAAEEAGTGARAMIADGLFERFPVDAVFGMHNWPGMAVGTLGFIWGPALASSDTGVITVVGKGGHGAYPQLSADPVLAAASIITSLQTIVSRNISPLDTAVVSIGAIHGGTAASIIPDEVELKFTLRAFKDEVRERLKSRLVEIAETQAAVYGTKATVEIRHSVAPLFNYTAETDFAHKVAVDMAGADQAVTLQPFTGGEDFAYMLQQRPGSFVHFGIGEAAKLHSPQYNFNDDVIASAALYWVRLAEEFLH